MSSAEDRGAEGVEGDEVWGGGVPLPNGKGFGEGAVPPPQNFFLIFCLGILHFGCNLMHFQT